MPSFALPTEKIQGLRPELWVSIGPGFAREDVKSLALAQGAGFVGEAITTLQGICAKIVPEAADRMLGPLARQETLRLLLADKRISEKVVELKRLRRQSTFFRRLDLAIQAGRSAAAHPLEESVYSERLEQRFGRNPVRDEIRALAFFYDAWLEAASLWDLPRLVRAATDRLERDGWPAAVVRPREIHHFSLRSPESLEKEFWETLSRHVDVKLRGAECERNEALQWRWQRWHTLDDAAESLAESLADDCSGDVVLIPDSTFVRRSLRRALEQLGIPLADARDPTRLFWDETLKWALLPLEVVARNYDRRKVISYLRAHQMHPEFSAWVQEINNRGLRQGLESYSGGAMIPVHSRLRELAELFGGRKTCTEVAEAHLRFLRAAVGEDSERGWVVSFFEGIWNDFVRDSLRVNQEDRRAPFLFWFERLQARVSESPAPVERLKAEGGLRTYRLHQAPVEKARRVWILGMPSQWLSGEGTGDYWFTEREREVLAAEFPVRSAIQARQERLAALKAWLTDAEEVFILDAEYDADGAERETPEAALCELAREVGGTLPEAPELKGSHPRWLESYGALRPVAPRELQLPAMPAPAVISATVLDSYSSCGFIALGRHRWKLEDSREPDTEMWPDVRGSLLHEAVRILASSRDGEGRFQISPAEALEMAWAKKRPRGLVRSPRVEKYVKSRLLSVLFAFAEKERDYVRRAGTRILNLENQELRLEFPDLAIKGIPDRLDESADGVFVIDYKTSSAAPPNGAEMLELGYRLQLPFYAVAAAEKTGKPVLGLQFIELNRKAGRSSGVFFKAHNGKEPGKFTNARSNSRSLLAASPEETWSQFRELIHSHARGFVAGKFAAAPKKQEKECRSCSMGDLCQLRRLSELGEISDE